MLFVGHSVACRAAALAAAIGWVALGAPADALTFVGSVDPDSPPGLNFNGTIEIGDTTSSNDDPRAVVDIAPTDTFTADEFYVGSDEQFFGQLLIRGGGGLFTDGTKVVADAAGSSSEPTFQVGRSGEGYAVVSGGAWLEISSSSGDISVGDNPTGVGFMRVTGTNSLVTIGDDLFVGNEGVGRLEIIEGGLVQFTESGLSALGDKDTVIGAADGSVGEVYVDGLRSRFRTGEDLTIGNAGHGLLSISNGAIVQADNDSDSVVLVGPKGRIALDGGTLQVGAMTINGVLSGSGVVDGDGDGGSLTAIGLGGRVEAGAGQLLRFDDNVSNQGMINIEGGEIEFLDGFTNNAQGALSAPGRITLEDGRVRFVEAVTNNGVIAVAAGASDIHGPIDNAATGAVVVAPDSVATFHDDFDDLGGTLDIQAGGSALFLANASFLPATSLSIALATGEPSLSVTGDLAIDGDFEVTFDDDFIPSAGTFELITAGDLTGTFDNVTLPTVSGFDLTTQYSSNSVLLTLAISQVGGVDGDFNNDGRVDNGDLNLLLGSWGDSTVPPEWVNGFSAPVNNEELNALLGNWGVGVPTAIPEPGSLVVSLLGGLLVRRRG